MFQSSSIEGIVVCNRILIGLLMTHLVLTIYCPLDAADYAALVSVPSRAAAN